MSKSIIDAAVDRFLSWRLPDDFAPDCGIVFHRDKVDPRPGWWPVGTNLLTANQVRAMFEHCLAQTAAPAEAVGECDGCGEVKPLMYCKVCFNQPLAMPADVEQLVTNQGVSSPDPDDLVAWLLSQTHVDIVEKRKQAAARTQADRERIAELGKANDQLFALGKSNYERAERAEASGKAWEIMCGGKQKIIEKLERERDEAVDDRERLTDNVCAVVQENEQLRINAERAEAEVARLTQERDEALLQEKQQHDNAASLATENAKLRRVVEEANQIQARGVQISQQYLPPDGISEDEALGEFIEVFDGPLQRAYDAAIADLEKP